MHGKDAGGALPLLMRNGERYEWLEAPVYAAVGMNENVSYRSMQLRLRQILILNQTQSLDYGMMSQEEIEMLQHQAFMVYTMKYAIIFIACAPMLVLYPFVQKYFVKGIMLGSVKS